ncbi:GNAT family N-acetyltransferase [Roseibium denhamense]|uniref:Ribosomal protein S18 acetylase RimI n=1 Tax=Roseibium denhamense TaxID=76305 RepID=A0ABY1NFV1_9HYPH|nr:GNAT family N-acetyltransferase [Roseibium denhamense]MTI06358.1 GNAT family N-acetyltransferase [Roseibium denhamense]SMP08565.1 Ribosomal protein S18 acetylase RimI [Roseibium denhamense]
MSTLTLSLDGYTDIPDTKIAVVVTYLEMKARPEQDGVPDLPEVRLERWHNPDPSAYKELFREVGEDWIWFGRLMLPDDKLAAILSDPSCENYRLMRGNQVLGMVELHFGDPENPEVSYFGLIPKAVGGGLGKWLMSQAIDIAWSRPETQRLWLRTCTADSPQAIKFYLSRGFKPYRRSIEIADDPRLLGLYPCEAAPHVPCLGVRPER